MVNIACDKHFFGADQPGQNGQAGGIGRGPAFRPAMIGVQCEDGATARLPAHAGPARGPRFIQQPARFIHQQQVPVTARAAARNAALDHAIGLGFIGDWIPGRAPGRIRIALVGVGESDPAQRRVRRHHAIRNAIGEVGAEIGMHAGGGAYVMDDRGGRGGQRRVADGQIPPIVAGKQRRVQRAVDDHGAVQVRGGAQQDCATHHAEHRPGFHNHQV
jgi:hypothetical protein